MDSLIKNYEDSIEFSKQTHELFCQKVNEVKELKALRDFVEQNAFGFGERSFYWMWKLIVDEMPNEFTFLEIGVFRGQTTTLIQVLAKLAGKKVKVYGVTPLDSSDGHWESDYKNDILEISKRFKVKAPYIFVGLSTNPELIKEVSEQKYDLVYIDGGHTYEVIKSDLENYPQLATKFLIIDDCANKFKMPFGYFQGIDEVSKAVDEFLPPFTENERFEHLFNVVHNRVWRVK
jgi:hypothetical protein